MPRNKKRKTEKHGNRKKVVGAQLGIKVSRNYLKRVAGSDPKVRDEFNTLLTGAVDHLRKAKGSQAKKREERAARAARKPVPESALAEMSADAPKAEIWNDEKGWWHVHGDGAEGPFDSQVEAKAHLHERLNFSSHKDIELIGEGQLAYCRRCKGGEAELYELSCDQRMLRASSPENSHPQLDGHADFTEIQEAR